MGSTISAWILRMMGWQLLPPKPDFPDKFILIVIPHTSNWDFPLGLLVRSAWGEKIYYVAKASLFRGIAGPIMKALGGYPVNRSKSTNFVRAVIELFNSKEKFAINIAPEGTRDKVDQLKSGFYYIAKGANIPVVMCAFDWGRKEIRVAEPWHPSGDLADDLPRIHAFYNGVKGFYPEKSYGIPPKPVDGPAHEPPAKTD